MAQNSAALLSWPLKAETDSSVRFADDPLELVRIFQTSRGTKRSHAFSAIYNRYSRSIWDYIYAQVNGVEAEAKDIFGQVWLIATEELVSFERRHDTRAADPLRAWLFTCAANRIKQYHREKHANVPIDLVENFLFTRLNGEDASAFELFVPGVTSKATQLVVAATDQLKSEQKLILWLRYNRSMTFAEIGAYIGKKENAVKVQHFRIIKKLRALCGELYPNE